MYGLSLETDLSPLSGTTLTFVGFGQYQLQLSFSGDTDCAIAIEGTYIVTPSGESPIQCGRSVDGAGALLALLGHVVAFAEVPVDGTVQVRFDDGAMVEVLDSSERFESYQVTLGDRLLVV